MIQRFPQGFRAAEHHIAVADDGAGLPQICHVAGGGMQGHGAEIAANHRVEQNQAVPHASQSLVRPKQLAPKGRFHGFSFLRSHMRSHISRAAKLSRSSSRGKCSAVKGIRLRIRLSRSLRCSIRPASRCRLRT